MQFQTHPHCHWQRTTRLSTAALGLTLLFAGWTSNALARCEPYRGATNQTTAIISALPASVTLAFAKIGEVMATASVPVGQYAEWYCSSFDDAVAMTKPTTGMVLRDESKKIYDSGIPGVGVRLGFEIERSVRHPPFSYQTYSSYRPLPDRMVVEFIRTDTGVGKGEISFDFESTFTLGKEVTIPVTGIQLRTRVEHSVYFTSCYNSSIDPTVNLGRPTVEQIKRGEATERSYSMDIRCDGMNPATKPPVKIYFEGNAVRDGLLRLNGDGQDGVAKGVGIALSNDKGVALPFAKAKALPLTWTNSGIDSEFYRFAGKARYTSTGGEIEPGKANGTLTYILEYN